MASFNRLGRNTLSTKLDVLALCGICASAGAIAAVTVLIQFIVLIAIVPLALALVSAFVILWKEPPKNAL